jgi:hypothetical protein
MCMCVYVCVCVCCIVCHFAQSIKRLEQEIRLYASRIFDDFSIENAFAMACMTRYFVILDDEDLSHHYFTIADSMCNRLEKRMC